MATKKELYGELELVREKILELDETAKIDVSAYDEITEKNSLKEIQKALRTAKNDLKILENVVDDEIEKALEKDGKKAVFKWVTLDGFYKMKLQTVTPEKIKVGYKISFRVDAEKIANIKDYFYYGQKKKEFTDFEFENGQDICTVKNIDESGEIRVVSDKTKQEWYLIPDDINGTKSTKCVIKDGSKIAFLVYAPVEK